MYISWKTKTNARNAKMLGGRVSLINNTFILIFIWSDKVRFIYWPVEMQSLDIKLIWEHSLSVTLVSAQMRALTLPDVKYLTPYSPRGQLGWGALCRQVTELKITHLIFTLVCFVVTCSLAYTLRNIASYLIDMQCLFWIL